MQLLVCRHLGVDLCSTICLFEGKNIVLCTLDMKQKSKCVQVLSSTALSMIDFGGLDFDRAWVTQAKQTSENELKKNYSLCSKYWSF